MNIIIYLNLKSVRFAFSQVIFSAPKNQDVELFEQDQEHVLLNFDLVANRVDTLVRFDEGVYLLVDILYFRDRTLLILVLDRHVYN